MLGSDENLRSGPIKVGAGVGELKCWPGTSNAFTFRSEGGRKSDLFSLLPNTKNLSSAQGLFQDGRPLDNISCSTCAYPGSYVLNDNVSLSPSPWAPTKRPFLESFSAHWQRRAGTSCAVDSEQERGRGPWGAISAVSGQRLPTPVAGCMRILILPAYPCRSYHVTCDGCTKACLGRTTLSQPLRPGQRDDQVPKPLNRIPLSSKSHGPVRRSNLAS